MRIVVGGLAVLYGAVATFLAVVPAFAATLTSLATGHPLFFLFALVSLAEAIAAFFFFTGGIGIIAEKRWATGVTAIAGWVLVLSICLFFFFLGDGGLLLRCLVASLFASVPMFVALWCHTQSRQSARHLIESARKESQSSQIVAPPIESSQPAQPVRFQCPHCRARVVAKEELTGRTVKCPQCGEKLTVPDTGPAAAIEVQSFPELSLETDTIQDKIRRPRKDTSFAWISAAAISIVAAGFGGYLILTQTGIDTDVNDEQGAGKHLNSPVVEVPDVGGNLSNTPAVAADDTAAVAANDVPLVAADDTPSIPADNSLSVPVDELPPSISVADVEIERESGKLAFKPMNRLPINRNATPATNRIADFDSDGTLDLATILGSEPTLFISLNAGDGNFRPAMPVPTRSYGAYPGGSFDVGDLDNDGDLDIVTSNVTPDTMSVLINSGNGRLQTRAVVKTGPQPRDVHLIDVDDDGDLDAVHTRQVKKLAVIAVFLNRGNATFGVPILSDTRINHFANRMSVADFDRDGDMDLFLSHTFGNIVSVMLNKGNRTFSIGETIPISSPVASSAADLDRDGDIDVAVTNAEKGTVTILLNKGDGTFVTGSTINVGLKPMWLETADIDGDGDGDLVVSNEHSDFASVLFNVGGMFPGRIDLPTPGGPRGTALGDLDGDGNLELAVSVGGECRVDVFRSVQLATEKVEFEITLSRKSTETVSVEYSTYDGTAMAGMDYKPNSGNVTFMPGQTQQTVTIEVIGDHTKEENESFFMKLSNPTGATIVDSTGECTIVDDD